MATNQADSCITLLAGADLSASQFLIVQPNSSGAAVLSAASDLTQIGVLQNKPASGRAATIQVGGVTKVIAGATVAAGARVTSDAAGKAIAATTGKQVIGVALTGGAANEVIEVLLSPRGVV